MREDSMSFIKKFIEQETINRRNLLLGAAYGVGGLAAARMFGPGAAQAALSDPDHCLELPQPHQSLLERDRLRRRGLRRRVSASPKDFLTHLINERLLGEVAGRCQVALLAKTNGNLALAIDTNDAPNARPVVESVAEAGAYVSTLWNKTDDLHPWDFGDNYVSHMTWSDEGPAETDRAHSCSKPWAARAAWFISVASPPTTRPLSA
jgi:ribose transport system substrate-binding protein